MPLTAHPFPVYVTRHGETAFNAQGRYQGARDDSPLTIRGREQAIDIALRLKDVFDGPNPPRFVSSQFVKLADLSCCRVVIVIGRFASFSSTLTMCQPN